MSQKNTKGISKLTLGMILLALGGLFLGAAIGYSLTNMYLNNQVLSQMKKEGYVLTHNATATSEDIRAGKSAYVNGQLVYGTKEVLETSDATAMAEYIRKGKTAYINGVLVVGTLEEIQGSKLKPGEKAVTVKGNAYLAGDITILGDADLKPANIFKGNSLWGIQGTMEKKPAPVNPNPEEGGNG